MELVAFLLKSLCYTQNTLFNKCCKLELNEFIINVMSKKGFTLVELLVTISILAILMSIAVISYSNIQKNTRDAKRKSDLATIQAALEQYHSDQGFYPYSLDDAYIESTDITIAFPLTSNTGNPTISSSPKIYLSKISYDPKNTGYNHYNYIPINLHCGNTLSSGYCTSYCIYNKVENLSNSIPKPANCLQYLTQYNYTVTAP